MTCHCFMSAHLQFSAIKCMQNAKICILFRSSVCLSLTSTSLCYILLFLQLFNAITFEVLQGKKVSQISALVFILLVNCILLLIFCCLLQLQAPRTRAVKNVRRHACSSIIKICRDYPQFILVNV